MCPPQAAKDAEKQRQREVKEQQKEAAKTGFGGKKALSNAASIMHVSAVLQRCQDACESCTACT